MQEQELLSTRPHLPTSAMTLYHTAARHVGDYTLCSSEEDAPREETS